MGEEEDHGDAPVYRNPNWVPPQLTLGVIECLTCFICLLYSIHVYKDFRSKRLRNLPSSLRILNLLGIISFFICSILLSINVYYWNTYYWDFGVIQTATWYSAGFCWSLGQIISKILFLSRLKGTFQDSMYKINKITLYYLYIFITIYEILWLIASVSPLGLAFDSINYPRDDMWSLQVWIIIPMMITDIFISVPMTVHLLLEKMW